MIDELESLGLDPELVRRQRDVAAGFAVAYQDRAEKLPETGREIALYAAATNFRRAGANSLLLDERAEATAAFASAANVYLAAGDPYGFFVGHLAGESAESFQDGSFEARGEAADVFGLWAPSRSWTERYFVEERAQHREGLEFYRTERIGILGFPVQVYLDVWDAMRGQDRGSPESIQEALLPVVSAFSGAVRMCRGDRYHWERLATPFHPAEPDVMALLVAVGKGLSARRIDIRELLADMPLDRASQVLIQGTLDQYELRSPENDELGSPENA